MEQYTLTVLAFPGSVCNGLDGGKPFCCDASCIVWLRIIDGGRRLHFFGPRVKQTSWCTLHYCDCYWKR